MKNSKEHSREISDKAVAYLSHELSRARKKHPIFPIGKDPVGAAGLSLIAEELGELGQLINNRAEAVKVGERKDIIQDIDNHMLWEASHIAVTAFRFMEEMIKIAHDTESTTRK